MLQVPSRVYVPLSAKLVLALLIVAVPSVTVIAGIAFYALRELSYANRQLHQISRSLESVRALDAAFGRAVTPLSDFVISGDRQQVERFRVLITRVDSRLATCAEAACHGAAREPSEMAGRLLPAVQTMKDRADMLMKSPPSGRPSDRLQVLEEMNQLGQQTSRQLERMSSTLLSRVESLQRESREVEQRVTRLMLTSMLLVVAVAVVIAYFISRRLLRPVRELLTGTTHVMRGNLAYRVPVVEKDEIGELAQSFNAMAAEIQEHRENLERVVQTKTAELKLAQDSLIQSEKLASIGLLASGVAHELNNPLTSILMNINLLMEEVENQPHLHAEMARINDDVLRCQRIIDELRDFSRRHELEIQPCDLNEVAKKALGLIAHEVKLRGITVSEELGARLESIPCDPARMQQVLVNVMINAIQAMDQGGKLIVRTGMCDGLAEVAIHDTGPGIAAEIRGKIFDPFFTTKPDGTGLGLSIVYRIVEEHGGKVEVESLTDDEARSGRSEKAGTTVHVFLPANDALLKR